MVVNLMLRAVAWMLTWLAYVISTVYDSNFAPGVPVGSLRWAQHVVWAYPEVVVGLALITIVIVSFVVAVCIRLWPQTRRGRVVASVCIIIAVIFVITAQYGIIGRGMRNLVPPPPRSPIQGAESSAVHYPYSAYPMRKPPTSV